MANYVILDIATAPLPDAADYLEEPEPHGGIKDPAKQALWLKEKQEKALAKAALDPDLCRVTAAGMRVPGVKLIPDVYLCRDEDGERQALASLGEHLSSASAVAVTFNGRSFDLPVLARRALYLGVPFPKLDLSRYKSPHLDLCELLADGEVSRKRSLDFYVRRLGWADLLDKPLAGEDEAKVFETGQWAELEASVRRDVEAVRRLAEWAGVIG